LDELFSGAGGAEECREALDEYGWAEKIMTTSCSGSGVPRQVR